MITKHVRALKNDETPSNIAKSIVAFNVDCILHLDSWQDDIYHLHLPERKLMQVGALLQKEIARVNRRLGIKEHSKRRRTS